MRERRRHGSRPAQAWPLLAAGAAVLLTAVVYRRVPAAYFYADDFSSLVSIVNDGFRSFVLRPKAGHNLIIRNVIFYGTFQLFGPRPEPYMWMVLLTHLANVWLLFRVLRTLTESTTLACFGALLWGTSPIHAKTLEWYSVFGQVLVATGLLVVLDRLSRLARRGEPVPARTACAWYAILLAGSLCFGVGVGVALVFPAVLFLLHPGAWRQPVLRVAYLLLPVVVVAVYFCARRLAGWIEPLSFTEELLEPRSVERLWRSLPMVAELVAFAAMATPQSFFRTLPAGPNEPWWPVLGLFGLGLMLLVWRGDARSRRAVVAAAIISLGAYLAVALGRAVMASEAVPLRTLAATPRYHHVGTIGVVIILCLVLQGIGRHVIPANVPGCLLLAVALAAGGHAFLRSDFVIDTHETHRRSFAEALEQVAAEVHGRPGQETVYLDNGEFSLAFPGPPSVYRACPGRAAVAVIAWGTDLVDGRPVRFIEHDQETLQLYRQRPGTLLARMLVPPGGAPAQ